MLERRGHAPQHAFERADRLSRGFPSRVPYMRNKGLANDTLHSPFVFR